MPSDLEEIAGDIANTHALFCQLPVVLLDYLEAFRLGVRGISLVRADFIFPERDLYSSVNEAHVQLLQLAEIIKNTATLTVPHLVSITEQDDDLVFTVDQSTVLLSPTQREVFIALALLGSKGPFLAEKFGEFAPADKSDASHNFENKLRLLKAVLPRLRHRTENSHRILESIIFDALPDDGCMKKHLCGSLAPNE